MEKITRGAELSKRLNFRPMQFSDLPLVYAMECRCHAFPWSEQVLADCLRAKYECWLVELSEQGAPPDMIGFLIVMLVLDESHLMNIVIDKSAQGKGYGLRALDFAKQIMVQHNASSMFLEVRQSNQIAQKLYAKSGFKQVGARKNYYPTGANSRETALVMKYEH